LPLDQAGQNRVLIKARGFDGIEHSAFTVLSILPNKSPLIETPPALPSGELLIQPFSNAVQVTFQTAQFYPGVLHVNAGNPSVSYELQLRDLNSYQATIPAPQSTGSLAISFSPEVKTILPINYVARGSAATVKGENFELIFEPDSLYWNTFVWPES